MSTISPFLFRAGSKQSRGINTAGVIDPLDGCDSQYHADMAAFVPENERTKLTHMIFDHINHNYNAASEFSSWSPSLLFVLVHAVRKSYSELEGGVLIYVMDTRRLSPSRMLSAVSLIKEHRIEWGPNFLEYTPGEWLIHGRLEHELDLWQAVDLKDLVAAGLFKIFPTLQDEQDLLYQKMAKLRPNYFGKGVWNLETDMLSESKKVAECFGRSWEGVMTIALITTRRRDLTEEPIAVLENGLTSMELPQLTTSDVAGLGTLRFTLMRVPEAKHFLEVLSLLHGRQQNRQPEAVRGAGQTET